MTLENQNEKVGLFGRLKRLASRERRARLMTLPVVRFGKRRYEAWRTARAERRAMRVERRAGLEAAVERGTAYQVETEDEQIPIIDPLADAIQHEREEEESGTGRGKFSWVTFGMFVGKIALGAGFFYFFGENLNAIPLVGGFFGGMHDFFNEVFLSNGLSDGGAGLGASIAMSVTMFGLFSSVVYADRRLFNSRHINAMSRAGEWTLRRVSDGAKWVWRLFGGRRKRRDEFAV
jgi:hypothetical protein